MLWRSIHGPKPTWKQDVKLVGILKISMYLLYKVLGCGFWSDKMFKVSLMLPKHREAM